jgi:arginyl-tRNA--protein-N-Asp/Glu arginylyltransferase
VTVQSRARPLTFLLTREAPCPYLPGRRERKLVTELAGPDAVESYDLLSRAGFRRSHAVAYRPACQGCQACIPVRVPVAGFSPGRSLRRVARRNANLAVAFKPARATTEQFALFVRYLERRHGDGEMAGMGFADYRSMVEDTPIDSGAVELRNPEGRLVGCCLVDRSADGLSAVYSFFDPDLAADSLGNYIVLRLIDEARRRNLPYVYLGYWIATSRKMAYKIRFRPLESFGPDGWARMPLTLEGEEDRV